LSVIFLILLYQRKYELNSYPFILISAFVSSFFFLFIFGYGSALPRAIESTCFAVILFAIMRITFRLYAQDYLLYMKHGVAFGDHIKTEKIKRRHYDEESKPLHLRWYLLPALLILVGVVLF